MENRVIQHGLNSIDHFIVINDFRALPVFAAYCIAKDCRRKGVRVLVSRRFVNFYDYGTQHLPVWYKSLKLFVLRQFCDVYEVPCTRDSDFDDAMLKGIDSSLQSITYDSGATEEKYPDIHSNLRQQALGAKEVAMYICSQMQRLDCVFVFNGRTASASPIVNFLHSSSTPIKYYEYSIRGGGYQIYPYPCHDSFRLGQDLIQMKKLTLTPIPDLYMKGIQYQENKINNEYTIFYETLVNEKFDIAIFLSSDHEYTNLQLDIVRIKVIGNLGLIEYVIEKYGTNKKVAIRAHPNQHKDPTSDITLKKIVDLCEKYGWTYFGPTSKISSHDLIRNSTLSVVEYSSIAFDAIFLGAKVDVVGDRDLKAILAYVQAEQCDKHGVINLSQFVREFVVLYEELFFYRFHSSFLTFFCRIVGLFERAMMKFSRFS